MDFSKTIVVWDLKLATDDRSDMKFLLTSKLCPLGAVSPTPRGCIHVLNHEKRIQNQTSKRFLWNFQQIGKVIRPFCWHQNFVPWGLSAPAPGLCTCIKSWKKCIKSDFKDMFWKLATNEWSDKTFLLTSKLCPLGAVCPYPGAIYMYKTMKKMYKIKFQRDFLKLATNNQRHKGVASPCPWLYACIKSWKKNV